MKKGAEKDKQQDIGGEHVSHDAEHAVTLVENRGAESRESIARMRDQVGQIVAVHTIRQHHDANDYEHAAHHPAGQFHADQNSDDGDRSIELRLRAGAVVDGLEVHHPVADGCYRKHDQDVVHHPHDC